VFIASPSLPCKQRHAGHRASDIPRAPSYGFYTLQTGIPVAPGIFLEFAGSWYDFRTWATPRRETRITSIPVWVRAKVNAMRHLLIPIASVAAFVLAGCDSVVKVYEPLYPTSYSDGELEYAARGGALKVDVRGNPFSMIPEEFAERVIAEMKGATRGPEVNFSGSPPGAGSAPYRVVMMFDARANANGNDVCAEKAETLPAREKVLRLLTAFCNGDVALTESIGWVSDVTGPDDEKFRELIRQTALGLLPVHDFRGSEPKIPD
jgi:hypothetical protein